MEIKAEGRGEFAAAQIYDGETQLAMIRPDGLRLLMPEVAQAVCEKFAEKGIDFAALVKK